MNQWNHEIGNSEWIMTSKEVEHVDSHSVWQIAWTSNILRLNSLLIFCFRYWKLRASFSSKKNRLRLKIVRKWFIKIYFESFSIFTNLKFQKNIFSSSNSYIYESLWIFANHLKSFLIFLKLLYKWTLSKCLFYSYDDTLWCQL